MEKELGDTLMITRKQLLKNGSDPDTHRKYYAQFITPEMEHMILDKIGKDRLLSSTDKHFNDIPLEEWYMMIIKLQDKRTGKILTDPLLYNQHVGDFDNYWHTPLFDTTDIIRAFRLCGDVPTLSGYICTFKECAKQIVERTV